jgi:hypothetical protein
MIINTLILSVAVTCISCGQPVYSGRTTGCPSGPVSWRRVGRLRNGCTLSAVTSSHLVTFRVTG